MELLQRFGANSAVAHDFGYAARKAGHVDAETRAAAVKLNRATRDARGTMGKRERLKIKGTLTPTDSAPPAASAVSSPVAPVAVPAAPVGTGGATNGAVRNG